jgi:hypothetical protein
MIDPQARSVVSGGSTPDFACAERKAAAFFATLTPHGEHFLRLAGSGQVRQVLQPKLVEE